MFFLPTCSTFDLSFLIRAMEEPSTFNIQEPTSELRAQVCTKSTFLQFRLHMAKSTGETLTWKTGLREIMLISPQAHFLPQLQKERTRNFISNTSQMTYRKGNILSKFCPWSVSCSKEIKTIHDASKHGFSSLIKMKASSSKK